MLAVDALRGVAMLLSNAFGLLCVVLCNGYAFAKLPQVCKGPKCICNRTLTFSSGNLATAEL